MNAPLTPHSRNASLTEPNIEAMELPSLASLKLHPHRSAMSIDALLTPPNSENIKELKNFDQPDSVGGAAETDVLFPSPLKTSAGLHLFAQPMRRTVSTETTLSNQNITQSLLPEQEQVIREWSQRDGPDWDDLKQKGTKRQRGCHTWDDLTEYEAKVGNRMSKPSQAEYELVAHVFHAMKASDPASWSTVIRPVMQAALPTKKRKILQDKSVTRRSLVEIAPSVRKRSSTPSIYGETSNSRRRASRNNLKASGAETKSARAASTKPPKDPDWWNYPDYAPKFEEHAPENALTLAANAHKFDNKDNKKGPRDLSADPIAKELTEAEVLVASWLHLDCHRYLTSKRQIFQGYVDYLRKKLAVAQRVKAGMEEAGHTKLTNWNKTEAQKLLGIDVSKGSYIWSFYKDLGWFEDSAVHLYEQHL